MAKTAPIWVHTPDDSPKLWADATAWTIDEFGLTITGTDRILAVYAPGRWSMVDLSGFAPEPAPSP